MTAQQIAFAAHKENVRHNMAVEEETRRANLAKEQETQRFNIDSVSAKREGDKLHDETSRYTSEMSSSASRYSADQHVNAARISAESAANLLTETKRHNQATETLGWANVGRDSLATIVPIFTRKRRGKDGSDGSSNGGGSTVPNRSAALDPATEKTTIKEQVPVVVPKETDTKPDTVNLNRFSLAEGPKMYRPSGSFSDALLAATVLVPGLGISGLVPVIG